MSASGGPLRILWVTPRLLSGTPDGARHATTALVRQLTARGAAIDLISIPGPGAGTASDQQAFSLRTHGVIPRSGSYAAAPPSIDLPWTFRTFATRRVQEAFHAESARFLQSLQEGEKAFVVFDGLHTAAAVSDSDFDLLKKKCGLIYRAHNVETELWEQCVGKTPWPWMRLFFKYQAGLVRRFEQQLAQRVDWVAPVSEQDAEHFARFAPAVLRTVIPIGMAFPAEDQVQPVAETGGLSLFFIGRLDWIPNRAGLKWFLDKIWAAVFARRPDCTLTIAGLGDSQWLDPYLQRPGINFLGEVSAVEPHYRASALTIAPLFQGSGTRVKIIEASRFARASISTALGAQGSGLVEGVSYFRAETESEWITLLTTLTRAQCRAAGLEAFRAGRARFDAAAIADVFEKNLRSLLHA